MNIHAEVVGYYTLVVGSVEYDGAPERLKKGLARHPVPIMLLARLAIAKQLQGKGPGAGLMKDAMLRTLRAADIAGTRAPASDIICDVRLVLDTDVIVAALRSPTGASAAILEEVRQGKATLLLSVPLAVQYEALCSQEEHRLAANLSEKEAGTFVTAALAMAEPVAIHFLWRPQLRDPTDEMVLETAINGQADALVTFNVRDFGNAPSRFGVDLLLPREAIARIRR